VRRLKTTKTTRPAAQEGDDGSAMGDLRILLVDDHAMVREGLRLVLGDRDPPAQIVEAGSYAQAQACLAEASFDLVLLDYFLPDTHGPASLRELLPRAGSAPIVVMSGECDGDLVRGALRAGARGFIPKKSTGKVMLAAIGVVLSGGVYVPPDALVGAAPDRTEAMLTERQRDVLQLLVDGRTNKEIAASLGTAESTVRVHLQTIFRSLGVENRTQACSVAIRKQLVRSVR
jgi:DNA-binding NarL/FixJ family response regulator